MMKSAKELHGVAIEAEDGPIGSVDDILFDDQTWQIRYLVADTGKWLPGRRVLIAPEAIKHPWEESAGIPVNLTREQVKSSPDIDAARPVSREAELLLFSHYGWAPYWALATTPPPPPAAAFTQEEKREASEAAERLPNGHLCSAREVMGYRVQGTDDKAGPIDDLMICPEGMTVRYLVVKTGDWLARKKVLIPPDSIYKIDWAESKVITSMSRNAIEHAPQYEASPK